MTHVRLKDVNVSIPIYDSHALRLIRLPSFSGVRVGSDTASRTNGVIVIHALKNLSFDLAEGDRVCLIGHNGAGKTTLLRLVAGIYPSTTGTVDVKGRAFSLVGGSMALNIDATGYENIRLIASLYKWPGDQYRNLVQDIEEFTELGVYLSLPTRIYSAGMHARLSFALATAQNPDIRRRRRRGCSASSAVHESCCWPRIRRCCAGRCAAKRWCCRRASAYFSATWTKASTSMPVWVDGARQPRGGRS
jgi:ABC-type polysaccharide/polyol phosphate transport system ATPase subunit